MTDSRYVTFGVAIALQGLSAVCVAHTAEEPVELRLAIDVTDGSGRQSDRDTLIRGQPLTLVVTVSNVTAERHQLEHRRSQDAERAAAARERRLPLVEPFMLDSKAVAHLPSTSSYGWADYVAVEMVQIVENDDGTEADGASWLSLDMFRSGILESASFGNVRNVPRHVASALPPDFSSSLDRGVYEIRARLDTRSVSAPDAWSGELVSKPLRLAVRDTETADDELAVHYLCAGYYSMHSMPEEVLRHTQVIMDAEPGYQGYTASLMAAQAMQAIGDLGGALATYEDILDVQPATLARQHATIERRVALLRQQLARDDHPRNR